MRRYNTRLHQSLEAPVVPERARLLSRRLLAAALLIAWAAVGCVTRGSFDEVAGDRDRLETERKRLETQVALLIESNNNLDEERAKLADEFEDVRQSNEVLNSDLDKVRRSEALLSDHLRNRETELSSTTEEIGKLRSTYASLVDDLHEEVAAGQIEIEQLREGVRVNLAQEILFGSGSTTLNESGQRVLRKFAVQFAKASYLIEVQGHTDNVRTSPRLAKRFETNWELAAARATQVVRILADSGVDPARLRAVSFGPYQPVASNDDRDGRAKNRRIEIRLTPLQPAGVAAGS